MSYFLLFPTTNHSKEVVETFLHETQRDPNASPAWLLIRTRSQPIPSHVTPLPIDGDFASDFAGATTDEMGAFFLSRISSAPSWLSPDTFVVLDERSARDGRTAIVMFREERMPAGMEEEEWDDEKVERLWRTWRVPMATAFGVTGQLAVKPGLVVKIFEREGADAEGVFHWRAAERDVEVEEKEE
ncbi:hypothetical protein SLS57_000227 [Botryosphaeria dothidea]